MTTIVNPCFAEALTSFVAAKKEGKKAMEGYQDLNRFIAWCGKERRVMELSPSEVADYAQHVGISGSDPSQRLTPVKEFLGFLKDEGWVQTGLASHLRVPRTRRATGHKGGSQSAANEASYMSQEGYQRLVAQLEGFKEERVAVVEDIKRAMADKDFRENAPLDAAKERQGFIEARIRELEAGLAATQILTKDGTAEHARQKAKVGSKVSLKDVASGKNLTYTLVDAREADASSGKISTVSPVGQALLERAAGDEVVINVPKGTLRYTVQKVER
ncbi:MAG: transcription elongation factor GreA [Dehalococcoidia bacterium]|nr:transcription elongation factor GreA [Dehalococcoidia bacterium]MSQ17721.1 transcription elongation factor GreA [Dehalococcoidia bacterium]